jgi:hypothetical protein
MEVEKNIKHETNNFYIMKVKKDFEIRCKSKCGTYSVVVGIKSILLDAIKTVERLEPHIDKYREFAGIN